MEKYYGKSIEEKLDYICIYLEMITDKLLRPQAIVAGDLIDQQLWTKEYACLREENVNLRDQLRWHSVDELPKRETANCSITVLLDIDYVGVFKVYYNFLSEIWVGVQGKQEYFRAEDFKNTKARWCYIPDDNQGTDCTPEGGDA